MEKGSEKVRKIPQKDWTMSKHVLKTKHTQKDQNSSNRQAPHQQKARQINSKIFEKSQFSLMEVYGNLSYYWQILSKYSNHSFYLVFSMHNPKLKILGCDRCVDQTSMVADHCIKRLS